jgi:hypothetical protein
MAKRDDRITELRRLAADIRRRAKETALSDYAEKMQNAATELEKAADALAREKS